MKKKYLLLFILLSVTIFGFNLTKVYANTNGKNSSDNKKATVQSTIKKYISTNDITQTSSNGFGLASNNGVINGNSNLLTNHNDSRFVDITLHAGNQGYFGTPETKEKISTQFIGDSFMDRTVPTTTDQSLIFLGWSKEEGSNDVDISADFRYTVAVSSLGTNLYAVYTNRCSVEYQLTNSSYIEKGGQQYTYNYTEEVECGTDFNNYIPVSAQGNLFSFTGWYDNETDKKITQNTKIDQPQLVVTSNWKYNVDALNEIQANVSNHYDFGDTNTFYKFTSSEDALYEVYVENAVVTESTSNTPKVSIYNEDGKELIYGYAREDHGISFFYTFLKGETYILEFGEMSKQPIIFDYGIRNAEYKTVTYHANRGEDAWFDSDKKTAKKIPYAEGTKINSTISTGLETNDNVIFYGWTTTPDGEYDPDEEIIVNSDMDLYADYVEVDYITLHANGGYFTNTPDPSISKYKYAVGSPFSPVAFAKHDDNRLAFAGWSTNKNATVPDADILEDVTIADDVARDLYAVYTDKILEIFDANGGYFMQDPSATIYMASAGKGRDFWGMTLYNDDSAMIALGWYDQDREFIPYTPEAYPYYHNKGDTRYTAVWGKKIILDANGGYFVNHDYATALYSVLEADQPFSLEEYKEQIGIIANDDASLYLAGWSTEDDATEPNVIEGVTPVSSLGKLYAVWKKDTYLIKQGDKSTWEKGSEEGLEFVVKRQNDDSETYSSFSYISVDGEIVKSSNYTRKEGSLILALKPEYLETLALGEHEIKFTFAGNVDVTTSFTINEKSVNPDPIKPDDQTNEKSNNPKTGDNIMFYISMLGLSVIGLAGAGFYVGKKRFN